MAKGTNAVRRRAKASVVQSAMSNAAYQRVVLLAVSTGFPVQLASYAAHAMGFSVLTILVAPALLSDEYVLFLAHTNLAQ
jgi:hypothetical protein